MHQCVKIYNHVSLLYAYVNRHFLLFTDDVDVLDSILLNSGTNKNVENNSNVNARVTSFIENDLHIESNNSMASLSIDDCVKPTTRANNRPTQSKLQHDVGRQQQQIDTENYDCRSTSMVQDLRDLVEIFRSGLVTAEEFVVAKKSIFSISTSMSGEQRGQGRLTLSSLNHEELGTAKTVIEESLELNDGISKIISKEQSQLSTSPIEGTSFNIANYHDSEEQLANALADALAEQNSESLKLLLNNLMTGGFPPEHSLVDQALNVIENLAHSGIVNKKQGEICMMYNNKDSKDDNEDDEAENLDLTDLIRVHSSVNTGFEISSTFEDKPRKDKTDIIALDDSTRVNSHRHTASEVDIDLTDQQESDHRVHNVLHEINTELTRIEKIEDDLSECSPFKSAAEEIDLTLKVGRNLSLESFPCIELEQNDSQDTVQTLVGNDVAAVATVYSKDEASTQATDVLNLDAETLCKNSRAQPPISVLTAITRIQRLLRKTMTRRGKSLQQTNDFPAAATTVTTSGSEDGNADTTQENLKETRFLSTETSSSSVDGGKSIKATKHCQKSKASSNVTENQNQSQTEQGEIDNIHRQKTDTLMISRLARKYHTKSENVRPRMSQEKFIERHVTNAVQKLEKILQTEVGQEALHIEAQLRQAFDTEGAIVDVMVSRPSRMAPFGAKFALAPHITSHMHLNDADICAILKFVASDSILVNTSLQVGDAIVSINGYPFSSADSFMALLYQQAKVTLQVVRISNFLVDDDYLFRSRSEILSRVSFATSLRAKVVFVWQMFSKKNHEIPMIIRIQRHFRARAARRHTFK